MTDFTTDDVKASGDFESMESVNLKISVEFDLKFACAGRCERAKCAR
jgi:hypothetical protein